MPYEFLSPVDFTNNQLLKARAENLASAPAVGNAGRFYFNTATATMAFETGSVWKTLLDTTALSSYYTAVQVDAALNLRATKAAPAFTGSGATFTATTDDYDVKVIKKLAADDAAFTLCSTSAAEPRASWGLFGEESSKYRVSADGTTWADVYRVTAATAVLDFYQNPTVAGNAVHHAGNFDPATKADASHEHGTADVTGLDAYVDGRADARIDNAFLLAGEGDTTIDQLIEVVARVKALSADLPPAKYTATVGGSTSIVVNHNLGTRAVTVQVYRAASPYSQVMVDIEHTDANNITLKPTVAPAAASLVVVVVG